jgi:hypothetical protein
VAAVRRRTGAGGGAPRGVDGVLVAGGQENSGEVARKLPQGDVVLVVCLAGANRQWIIGTTARPSGGRSSSSPAQWSGRSSTGKQNWVGLGASVVGSDAAGVLDQGWGAVAAAVDGEPRQRRGSGEVWSSEKRKAVETQVREGKSEFVGSSRTCFKSRKRHHEREQVLASSAARVAAWATAARRGGARRGPAEAGKRRAGCRSGTWREERKRGGSWSSAHGRRGWQGRAERKQREGD